MERRSDNAVVNQRSNKRFSSRDSLLGVGEKPALASHLVTARTFYRHHGIYVGNGRVIHYSGPSHGLRRGPVEEVSVEYFARGHGIRLRHDQPRFNRREVVARARSRLGERRYRILTNNCEHFCEWCLNGASRSSQVERWLSGARRFTWALLGTLGLAAGTPALADPASHHVARVDSAYTRMSQITTREMADSARASEQVPASTPASGLPTIVLSRTGALRRKTPDSRLRDSAPARPAGIQHEGKNLDLKLVTALSLLFAASQRSSWSRTFAFIRPSRRRSRPA